MIQKPWRQLTFMIGEAALSIVSGGAIFIFISHSSGPDLLGVYALVLAWLLLFQGLSSFGIPEFLMREVGIHGCSAGRQIYHAMLLGIVCGAAAILLMLGAVRSVGYGDELVDVISVSSLALIPSFLSGACRSVFLALRRMHLNFLALMVEATIISLGSLYLLLTGHGAMALVVVLVIGKLASATVALVFLRKDVLQACPPFEWPLFLDTACTVLTFGIGSLLGMVTMRINTIIASAWVNIADVGQYAAATKIAEVGLIVPSLYAQLLMTRMACHFNVVGSRDPNRFGAWYETLFAVVVPTCVGIWVFADPILHLLFGGGFEGASWILRILMIYLMIESVDVVMSVILTSAHQQRVDVTCLAFNPLTNIALNLTLLPVLGTVGAALGRVGGAGVSSTLRNLMIARRLAAMNWVHFIWKPVVISVSLGAISSTLFDAHRPTTFILYAATAAVLLCLSSSFSFAAIKDLMSIPSREGDDVASRERIDATSISFGQTASGTIAQGLETNGDDGRIQRKHPMRHRKID